MHVRLSKQFSFEAAHFLPSFPEGHKCRRLHGHSFHVEVAVAGDIDEATGVLVDYGDIKAACKPVIDALDHRFLNEIDGLAIPTSENVARWIWERLVDALPMLDAITVRETCTSSCEYRGR